MSPPDFRKGKLPAHDARCVCVCVCVCCGGYSFPPGNLRGLCLQRRLAVRRRVGHAHRFSNPSREQLAVMLPIFIALTASHGLRWGRQFLCYAHSLEGSPGPLWIWAENEHVPIQEDSILRCLGTVLQSKGGPEETINHRPKKTTFFWANDTRNCSLAPWSLSSSG